MCVDRGLWVDTVDGRGDGFGTVFGLWRDARAKSRGARERSVYPPRVIVRV